MTREREESDKISSNVTVNGRRTSLRLEREFWDGLYKIARDKKTSVNELVSHVDKLRSRQLTAAVRGFVLDYFRDNQ
ncbi:Ribbon-helix-helix domain-containing protein [Limimonas halophila]|uniref:Ribbon-helix-helix domain-containing protein n=1 Tax=Limimonas halophila TaxID=1082479 RepID=A0A1G7SRQ3_9PROT|nr:ribbon-helix-helix domain-containing protein [Limimonas halophila]SDG25745.1 Ribbon-helix-helix domain-containing protein [Limimonas halophila]